MANGRIPNTGYAADGQLQAWITWDSVSNGSVANTSNVTGTFHIRKDNSIATTGTYRFGFDIAGTIQESSVHISLDNNGYDAATITAYNVPHNNDGTGTCTINGWVAAPDGTSLEGRVVNIDKTTIVLDKIPRYASLTQSLNNAGLDTIKMNWNSDSVCDLLQYSINNGNWINTSGNPYTISGLNPNTTYNIKTRVRRQDSQLYSETSNLSVTTKQKGLITNLPNFEHGNSVNVQISNASDSLLSLLIKIGDISIATKNVVKGNNTITFTEAELDNIYKLYGSSNLLTATFILTTVGKYTDTKTCNITLKGNQKTVKTNLNASWKRGYMWTNVDGSWKRAVLWTNVNGSWKRGI